MQPCSFAAIFGKSMSMSMYYSRLWAEVFYFSFFLIYKICAGTIGILVSGWLLRVKVPLLGLHTSASASPKSDTWMKF